MVREVKVNLTAGTAGFTPPMKDASATTLKLDLALKQTAASAKEAAVKTVAAAQAIAVAEKQTALTATQAAAAQAAGDEEVAASKKMVAAAAKDLAATEKVASRAIATAEREAAAAGREVVVAQKAIETQAQKTADAQMTTAKRLATAGGVLVGAFVLAEKATSGFDTAMSGVKSVANATPKEMDSLADAALRAGKATAYGATQAADAEDELVKAGVSVQDTLGGALSGTLSLAAAGNLDVAKSATIAANEMNTFKLEGKDVGHVADVMAAGANKSAADVGELADGMSQGGLVAHQMGMSLEDTTATLSAFADEGLHGADAGTSMKTMLERLASPTGAAADQMKSLGIETYDASGNFVGIVKMAGQLHDKLGPLTQQQRNLALQTIFGSDAIRAATVLYDQGATGMQGYVDSVNDSGAASRMADAQMNNLSGDLRQLKGSLDVALIQTGSGANSVLRDMTQGATTAVNAFASLPKPVQEAASAIAGADGSTLLLVGGATTAIGKISTFRKGLAEAEATAEGFKGGIAKAATWLTGPWGLAATAGVALIGLFASGMGHAKISVGDFTQAIKDDSNALGQHTSAAIAADLSNRKVYDGFTQAGISMDTVTRAAMGNADAMRVLQAATDAAGTSSVHVMGRGQSAPDTSRADALRKNLDIIKATAAGLHDQQHAQLQATAAEKQAAASATDDASVQARLAQAAKENAAGQMQRTAASRAAADAARADASGTTAAAAAAKNAAGASTASAKATTADGAAKKADAAAAKASAKASDDAAKAKTADAKASTAAANAADSNSYANSTNAGAAKSAAAATKDKTQAQNADTRASTAAETAARAAARAHDANAKATSASAKAAGGDAQAQSDAAEAAREAALTHALGAEALRGWAAAAADTTHTTDTLDDSVSAEVDAMKAAQDQANGLKDALDALNGIHISAGRAAVDVQNKVAGLTKALHDNGTSLDITTQAGRDNMNQIYDLADAISQHAEAVTQETGSVYAGNQALQASKTEFDKVLAAAGVSKTAIQQFNEELLSIPPTKPVTISVDSAAALAALRTFKNAEGDITAVHIGGTTGRAGFSHGGLVDGDGTDTSDSVPINASKGEFIFRAAAVRRIGVGQLNRLNFGTGTPTLVKPQMIGSVGGTSPHAGGAAAATALELRFAGNVDQALATVIMKLARDGKIVPVLT